MFLFASLFLEKVADGYMFFCVWMCFSLLIKTTIDMCGSPIAPVCLVVSQHGKLPLAE